MGNEKAIGHGRDFKKYFGIDYNAPGAWEAIADSILAIITTWSVYGYNQNEREDKRVGLNLGFTTKLKNNDIFASVIIGSNGFIVTVHIDDSPIKKLQCAFDDQTIPKERFSVKCKFCSNIYTTNNRLKKHLNKKHTDLHSCDICKEKFKTEDEIIDHKQLLHTTSVNITEDELVLIDGQDCKKCDFNL